MSESTDLQRALESLTLTIEKLRDELVRKDVYEADSKALARENEARDREMRAGFTEVRAQVDRVDSRMTHEITDIEKQVDVKVKAVDQKIESKASDERANRKLFIAASLAFLGQFLFDIYTRSQGLQ